MTMPNQSAQGIGSLSLYITVAVGNALLLKFTSMANVPPSELLFMRGLFCCIVIVIATKGHLSQLVPKASLIQMYRFMLAGISLYLIIASYKTLNAGSVAVISRMDISMAILLGSSTAIQKGRTQRWFALATIGFTLITALSFRDRDEALAGYILAGTGTAAIAVGYLLIKKSAEKENDLIIALTPAVASMFFGMPLAMLDTSPWLFSNLLALLFAICGLLMFGLYKLTSLRYRALSVARAEYPSILAAVLTIPAEAALFQKYPSTKHFILLTVILISMTITVHVKEKSYEKREIAAPA